jgi:hypothetical protein
VDPISTKHWGAFLRLHENFQDLCWRRDVFVIDLPITIQFNNPSNASYSHPPLACIIGAQYHITCTSQELKMADGYPFSLITLNAYSVSAFEAFHLRSEELYEAVKKRFVLEQLETLQRLQ